MARSGSGDCFEYVFRLCHQSVRVEIVQGLLVEPQTCVIFPLGASVVDLAGGDLQASEAEVCGLCNYNTHTRFD
jgi:hypothetical protein